MTSYYHCNRRILEYYWMSGKMVFQRVGSWLIYSYHTTLEGKSRNDSEDTDKILGYIHL